MLQFECEMASPLVVLFQKGTEPFGYRLKAWGLRPPGKLCSLALLLARGPASWGTRMSASSFMLLLLQTRADPGPHLSSHEQWSIINPFASGFFCQLFITSKKRCMIYTATPNLFTILNPNRKQCQTNCFDQLCGYEKNSLGHFICSHVWKINNSQRHHQHKVPYLRKPSLPSLFSNNRLFRQASEPLCTLTQKM